MTYKVTIKRNGLKQTAHVEGIRALHTALANYRTCGYKIAAVKRIGARRRMVNSVLQLA